jgi:nicotinate-nucleotide--dimethylbenzimidazole phosphoribosyltransferase
VIDTAAALAHLDALAKPRGSLGALEALAARLAATQGTLKPQTRPRRIVLFAADHGCVAAGVTAWPSAVTGLMVATIAAGKAASSVLARSTGTDLRLVDVGTLGPKLDPAPGFYRYAPIRAGTANLAVQPAMTIDEFDAVWALGRTEARLAELAGGKVVAAGEMGIGNTTPSACLAMLLADVPLDQAVGPGAGSDDKVMATKREVVAAAVGRARTGLGRASQGQTEVAKAAIAAVAGLELVAMAGFYASSAEFGITVVLDGYVSGAAALIAQRLAPSCINSMIAGHCSAEPGHRAVLAKLGLTPVLDWSMRLGEGTGALLAMPMLDAAAAILSDMATLADVLGPPKT